MEASFKEITDETDALPRLSLSECSASLPVQRGRLARFAVMRRFAAPTAVGRCITTAGRH
jgi:hypothetical protein